MQSHIRTKIICTIGPAVSSYEKILELIHAGMNVARLNFSHGDHAQHKKTIDLLKKAREETKKPLAIMLDTKGPEIRVNKLKNDALSLKKGQKLLLVKKVELGDEKGITFTPISVLDEMQENMTVLFDDGYITAKVVEKHKDHVVLEIENDGTLKSNKKITIPHGEITLPALTKEDVEDLIFGCKEDIDLVAASFIRSADNVLEMRKILKKHSDKEIAIVSKIESVMGVKNFESILQVSDGIMVARGDLGVELALNQVPRLQKMMIAKCNLEGKPCVIATQMLESMIQYPRPTRAEVSDVANAILDSACCVMLSGETAVGKYPIESAKMMRSIIEETEKDFDYVKFFDSSDFSSKDISTSVALATVKTVYSCDVQAIFTYTSSGFTPQMISRFRPKPPILALTSCKKTYNQLAFHWGVVPINQPYKNQEEAYDIATCFAITHHYVHYGDIVVVTAGTPFGIKGTTNMMIIKSIGNVVVRGKVSEGKQVYGPAIFILTYEKIMDLKGKIAIIGHCSEEYEAHLKDAKGVILQNHREDKDSEKALIAICKKHNISYLIRAESARSLIKEAEMITLVPSKGLVFRGEVVTEEEILSKVCHKSH